MLDGELDRGFDACLLAKPELSQIVADALRHFDGDRYVLTDFVVAPNHVHLLFAFPDEGSLLRQCTSWKRYTVGLIKKTLGRHSEFWQREQFDHLVRRLEKFEQLQRYIAENPQKAKLAPGMYRHYSAG